MSSRKLIILMILTAGASGLARGAHPFSDLKFGPPQNPGHTPIHGKKRDALAIGKQTGISPELEIENLHWDYIFELHEMVDAKLLENPITPEQVRSVTTKNGLHFYAIFQPGKKPVFVSRDAQRLMGSPFPRARKLLFPAENWDWGAVASIRPEEGELRVFEKPGSRRQDSDEWTSTFVTTQRDRIIISQIRTQLGELITSAKLE